jgi:secreted trypsin-like serine protease
MRNRIARIFLGATGFLLLSTLSASAITYGEEETQAAQKYPWVVLIFHYAIDEDTPDYSCTGTLITPNTVLTAGHCVDPRGRFEVKYGITTFDEEGKSLEVTGAWRSPRYSERRFGVNDIGLLRLKEKIPNAKTVPLGNASSIKLAESSKQLKLFGWGIDQNEEQATYLRIATVINQSPLLKKILGKSFNSDVWYAAGRYISKERIYSGACSGDSGGPLMGTVKGKFVQIGITSFGAEDCDTSNPTIFMRVGYYLKDLAAAIKQLDTNEVLVDRSLPKNITPPSISGQPEVGQSLICNSGQWSANAKTVDALWANSNNEIVIRGSTLEVTKDLASSELQCVVIARSAAGSVIETKTISIADSKPAVLSNPVISGNARVGSVVTCSPGTWNKFTTSLGIEWFVGSRSVSSANSITIPEEAAGQNVTCRVVGTGIVGTSNASVSIQIPAKPLIQGTLAITGLPTSGYAAGNGLVIQCTGANATGAVESFEIAWYLRDSSTGTPVSRVATGQQYVLPNGFFEQNKGRVVICGYSAVGPGGVSSVFDVETIVAPRLPEAPSVQVTGFPSYGSNANAWLNLPITCKIDSFFDNSVPKSFAVQWRIYDSTAPYYPLATTPSTPIGSGATLVLTQAILEQAALKSIGCAATVITATGSATSYSTKTYVDYRNIELADTTPPTFSFVSAIPYNPPLRFNDPIVLTINVSDTNGISKDSAFSFRAIGPNSNEVSASRVELPYLLSGTQFAGKYEYKIMLSPGSTVVLGTYRLLINITDTKWNSTGWQQLTTLEITGVRTN